MHGNRVLSTGVHAFDDVCCDVSLVLYDMVVLFTNFALSRPIWTEQPIRWPCAATIWHMVEVQYEKTMSVGIVADESDGGSTRSTPWPFVRGIDVD